MSETTPDTTPDTTPRGETAPAPNDTPGRAADPPSTRVAMPVHETGLPQLPADRVEVTRLVVLGTIQTVKPGYIGGVHPLRDSDWRWHQFDEPDGFTVLVLSRRKRLTDGEITLDHDGNPTNPATGGGAFVYPGALTLAEARGAHAAWCAWRDADQLAKNPKATDQQRDNAERLRDVYERIKSELDSRATSVSAAYGQDTPNEVTRNG
jgi:hypothetical protein